MSMDMFLKHAEPGIRVPRPNIQLWPRTFIKVFKIPEVVKVFLFSVFNEIYLPSYTWKERAKQGERFTMGFNAAYSELRNRSIVLPLYDTDEFCERLQAVGDKVDKIWVGAKKILLRYDKTRAKEDVQQRFEKYERAVEAAVNWPVVEIYDSTGPEVTSRRPHLWCHYSKEKLKDLHEQILSVEKNYQPR